MAMLTVYLDASGKENDPAFAVGGFVSTVQKWGRFQRYWQKMLDDEHLDFFHMTDFESYQGQYKGWTKARHDKVAERAFRILRRNTEFVCSSVANMADFRASLTQKHLERKVGNAYCLCVQACVKHVTDWARSKGHNSPIEYVLESGDLGESYVRTVFKKLLANEAHRERFLLAAEPSFRPKTGPDALIQLQAADIAAYEAYKHAINRKVPASPTRNVRKSLGEMLRISHDSSYIESKTLSDLTMIWDAQIA